MNTAEIYQHPANQPHHLPNLPPHSREAEEAVVGSCLTDASALDLCRSMLKPESFVLADLRLLWSALVALQDAGVNIDPISIKEHLKAQGQDEDNAQRLFGLCCDLLSTTTGTSNVVSYAKILKEYQQRRDILELAAQAQQLALNPGIKPQQLQAQLVDKLSGYVADAGSGATPARILAEQAIERFTRRCEGKQNPMGLSTGLKDLDAKTLGMHGGQLWIVAARPAMGKTTLALKLCAAVMDTRPVLVVSMEMDQDALTDRILAQMAYVDIRKIKDPNGDSTPEATELREDELIRCQAAVQRLKQSKLIILDQANITTTQLRAEARKIHRQHLDDGGLGLVVVDYLQLMSSESGRRDGNRTQEVSEQSRALKLLARELGCPVVCLSQLNRDLEKRDDKRPRLSDLRDSGSIEQDADVVAMLYRDEVYHPNSSEKRGIAEVIIAKQREGETGTVYVAAQLHQMNFADLTPERVAALQSSPAAPAGKGKKYGV